MLFITLYKMVQTFESVEKILKCDHSDESYWAVLLWYCLLCYTTWQRLWKVVTLWVISSSVTFLACVAGVNGEGERKWERRRQMGVWGSGGLAPSHPFFPSPFTPATQAMTIRMSAMEQYRPVVLVALQCFSNWCLKVLLLFWVGCSWIKDHCTYQISPDLRRQACVSWMKEEL